MKAHLARYKRERLGVAEDGLWRNNQRPYPHILPENLYRLNIIETIRSEFWHYYEERRATLPLHTDFHHLNSSQALAFNLFFPWAALAHPPDVLFHHLGLDHTAVPCWFFEHMPDQVERTTFDVYAEFPCGARLLFEVKLTEEHFGGCLPNAARRRKLEETYAPRLNAKVVAGSLEEAVFFFNYQLFRNVSHLDVDRGDLLVLVMPRANEFTWQQGSVFRQKYLLDRVQQRVRLVALEDFLAGADGLAPDMPGQLHAHNGFLREKYLAAG